MAGYLPEIADVLPDGIISWDNLEESVKTFVRKKYHRYLMAREHTRRFLLETNNLVLDLVPGDTSSLEDFKRLHRAVDVLKELEEAVRRKLENERRSGRIQASDLGDPDIENVTLIGLAEALKPLIGKPCPEPEGDNP